ncbi:MAG: ectonucleotide pyrophosphatase/phosphodiesterase [Turicibacter sp.]|nr:ectonucleotide pyrophosphatase/phosphodiesterase [Turicibacter sp.]
MTSSKRLLVLSFDALGGKDFEFMKTLPAFADFFQRAAVCDNVSSIYPSVTYACHTSIVTGKLPNRHGIICNTLLQPGRLDSPDWYWQRKDIKGETVYDVAIKNGLKVGAFLWPVTGKSKIQYNVPEIFPNRAWDNQVMVAMRNGSPGILLDVFRRFSGMMDGIRQPNLDDFVTASVNHTISSRSPELLLVHFTDLDTARHDHGVNSPEANDAIRRLEKRFVSIMDTLKENGLFESTNVVILGDHYQLDVHTKVPLNEFFAKQGWLDIKSGKVKGWQVLAKSHGGSAYIYAKLDIRPYLEELMADEANGIERILTGAEAGKLGADGNCQYMLEAKTGFVFTDSLGGGEKGKFADHGYHPTDKPDYATFFAGAGPAFKEGAWLEKMSLMDHGPTWAKILGLELNDTDGRVLDEILKEC